MDKWKMVPVEPTDEMIYWIATGAHRGDLGKEIWSEALAYAPAPAFDKAAERAAAHQSFEEQMPIMCSLDEFTAGWLACARLKAGVTGHE